MVSRRKDISGKRFERITVVDYAYTDKFRRAMWNCVCDCGKKTIIATGSLTSGDIKSCGCFHRDAVSTKDGGSLHPLWSTWCAMMARCGNKKATSFERYGARGIFVCDEWHDFKQFLADMGDKPSEKHQLERINNDDGYYQANCKWVDIKTQARNRRSTLYIDHHGERKSLAEWCDLLELPYKNTWRRIKQRNWSIEKAFSV